MMDHEKLDVYQKAIEFFALATKTVEDIPRGNSSLADQLKRASLSIPLNIAEGVGKVGTADKQRFYAIARGSALECAAIFDAGLVLGLIESEISKKAKQLLERIVSMLTKMCGF